MIQQKQKIKDSLDLSPLSTYYNKDVTGKCQYRYDSGPKYKTLCNQLTERKYCSFHESSRSSYKKSVNFLKTMINNPELLENITNVGIFFSTCHDAHGCDEEDCEDCYSGDTEFEQNETLKDTVNQLVKLAFIDDSDGEEESEDVEIDDFETIQTIPIIPINKFKSIEIEGIKCGNKNDSFKMPWHEKISPRSKSPEEESDESECTEIKAVRIKDGLFREVNNGYIFNAAFVVICIEVDGVTRPLNQKEKEKAVNMGLYID